jgi:ribokinase
MLIVFGSLNVDMVFEVDALPRPGETVLCPGYALAAGGKGANQAAAAAKAGYPVRMIGRIGDDDHGRFARASLEAAGVEASGVQPSVHATGVAVIGVDARAENQIIVGSGANLEASAGQVPDAALGPGVTVLCQNEVPAGATFELIRRARAQGARTVLNLAPAAALPGDVLGALDVLVVNEHEARAAAGAEADADPAALARALHQHHGLTCVVTLGGAGALAFGPDGSFRAAPLPVQAVDTTGAGDTFVGVLTGALDAGRGLAEALRRASVAGGLACTGKGAQTAQPDAPAIEAALADLPPVTALG